MQKRIVIFYSIVAVLGLVSEVFFHYGENYIINILKSQTGFVSLEIMGSDWYRLDSNPGYQDVNCFNALFYILLLIGTVQYAFDSKKSGILRFGVSVMFLSRIVNFLFWLLAAPYLFKAWAAWGGLIQMVAGIGISIFFIWVCAITIRYLNSGRKLKTNERHYGDTIMLNLVTTDKLQRFYHLCIDLLLTILIFSPILKALVRIDELYFIPETLEKALGERGAMYFIIIFFRFIYYMMSEGIFQSSPAKFLTGSRVVNADGGKIKMTTLLMRTLSRFVPFEAFSFFGGRDGWHDRWTDTHVVKEE